MPTFHLPRDRDAWGIIRGYVYQVDLTIDRWLALEPGQLLALEQGEDIDLVSRSLTAADDKERERLLEQVKHRDTPLTLRTPAAVGALACAVEHRRANPELTLFFRYTTNAVVAREKASPMPDRAPALVAWEQLRKGELPEPARAGVLRGLRLILADVRQPENLPDDTWAQFRDFLVAATDEDLLAFVRRFEWGSEAPEAHALGPRLQGLLRSQGFARDEREAEQQYQRLFLVVFTLLCQPGAKRLTVEDRSHHLALPTLSATDHALLQELVPQLCRLEGRVTNLEQGFQEAILRGEQRGARVEQQLSAILTAVESPRTTPPTVDDAELDEAKGHIDRFEFSQARWLLQRLQSRQWGNLSSWQKYRVLALLGSTSLGEGKWEDAGKLFLEAVVHQPGDEKARTNEAVGYELLGQRERAFALASALRKDFAASARAVAIWIRTAPPEHSPDDLESAIPSLHAKEGEVLVAVAMRAMRENAHRQAERLLRSATAHSPDWPPAWALLGKAILSVELAAVRHIFSAIRTLGDRSRVREAVESFTKAIDLARQQHSPQTAESLADRAVARECLGETEQAGADFLDACAAAPDDPDVHLRFGKHLCFHRKLEDAITRLRRATALGERDEAPFYLALSLRQRGRAEDRREAQDLFRQIAADPASARLDDALELALEDDIHAKRWGDAEALLSTPGCGAVSGASRATLRAKLQFARGERDAALAQADTALVSLAADAPTTVVRRLAMLLTQLGRDGDALPLWQRIALPGDDGPDNRQLVAVADRLGRYDVVLQVCKALREAGTDDPWVFHQEVSLLERYHPARAADLLETYLRAHPDAGLERVRLTVLGLRLGRQNLVTTTPDNVPPWDTVLPANARVVVSVLRRLGHAEGAMRYAYLLLRHRFTDPAAHQAYLLSTLPWGPPHPRLPVAEVVEVGSAVRFTEDGEDDDQWFILEDAPSPNPQLHEYPPDHFCSRQLLGKRVGDSFVLAAGSAKARTGVVREIVSKYVYRGRDCMDQWQVRFPDHPGLEMIRMATTQKDGEEQLDMAPIFASLDRRYQRTKDADEIYHTHPVPIHLLGEWLGGDVLETMRHLAWQVDLPIRCCGGSEQDREAALAVIRESEAVVLDLTAVSTLGLLDLSRVLRDSPRKLIVAQATMEELRTWAAEAGMVREHGFLGKDERGYIAHEVSEEDQHRWRDFVQGLADAVAATCEILPGEALVSLPPETRNQWIEFFGQAGLESVVLASQSGRVLWTDDWVMAGMGGNDFGVRRVWTQTALLSRTQDGSLDEETYAEACAKLAGYGYAFTSVNDRIVLRAAALAAWNPDHWPLKQTLNQFGAEESDLRSCFPVAAQTIVRLYGEPILAGPRERVMIRLLECLGRRRRGWNIVRALDRALPGHFGLNVVHAMEAREIVRGWLAASEGRIFRF